MTTPVDFATLFNDKITNTIYPQFQQLLNLQTAHHVNTGDRVKDGILVVIINTSIALILSWLWNTIMSLYTKFTRVYDDSNVLDVDEILKHHTKDTVSNYKFIYNCDPEKFNCLYSSNIINYLKDCDIISRINATEKTTINCYSQCYKHNNKLQYLYSHTIHQDYHKFIFIPVHKYVYNGKDEYIFLLNNTLYSQSSTELGNFLVKIREYQRDKSVVSDNTAKYVYELDSKFDIINRGEIRTEVTMDKIHFEQKPLLMEWIEKFSTNTIYPKDLCLTNKLGILLYGPPGSGKTGCISALANHLKRNILIINSLKVCEGEKEKLLEIINQNQKTHVIVLDEFDYLLGASERQPQETTQTDYREMLLYAEGDERKNVIELMKTAREKQSKIDIGFIIKLFDGINSNEDRCIIATTNSPDKINPVLLRPGRFDLCLKLGYCTWEMFRDIVHAKYPNVVELMDTNKDKLTRILALNVTPLVLINNLVTSSSFEELTNLLVCLPQQHYDKCIGRPH